MKEIGLRPNVIRAGMANLFLSPLFRHTLATVCDARIELLDTDGALGAGFYRDAADAFATLGSVGLVEPVPGWKEPLEDAYGGWKARLEEELK